MYTVYLDGAVLYDSTQENIQKTIINPKITLEKNKPGLFSFVQLPGHTLYNSIERRKSEIKVVQNGREIFRGRVMDEETDTFNQKTVNCKCELAFFRDTIQRPYKFEGTPLALFQRLISAHNAEAGQDKQFTIGRVTAVTGSGQAQVDMDGYTDTFTELENRILGAYGGHFLIRHTDGVRYIDYLADGDLNRQPIEFGVNLLDLKKRINAGDVFTVLIPQGAMQRGSGEALKINDVNGGLDYLEDAAGVANYGRIWKTKSWGHIEDAAELKAKGESYLQTGIDEETTLTIKAVDMRFTDPTKTSIMLCDKVHILSNPHGVDREDICTKLEAELDRPQNTRYTFGKPRTTLTDNVVLARKAAGGGGGGSKTAKEEISDVKRWAGIQISETEGIIDLIAEEVWYFAGEINTNRTLIKQNAEAISMRATTDYVEEVETDLTVSIEGIRGQIQLGDQIMAELALTIEGLDNWVTDADGNVSELTNEVRGLQSTVTTVDGKIVTLSNTADGFRSTIMEQGITLAELKTVNDQISATMRNVEGDIGSLVVTSDAVTAKVQTADNRVAALVITADGLTNTIAVQGVELAALKTRVDEISASVTDGNNAAASLVIQANRIMQKVTDIQDGTMASLEILDDRITQEVKNLKDDTSASFEVMADSINSKVAKGEVISEINQTAEAVKISAQKINLEGYVTASELAALNAQISNLTAGITTASWVRAENLDASIMADIKAMRLDGKTLGWRRQTFVTSAGTLSQSKRFLNIMLADGSTTQLDIVTNVSLSGGGTTTLEVLRNVNA